MSILDIKKKIGYVDRTIPIIIPQHDDDVCYVYGYPFHPMSYNSLKMKGIKDNNICKCQTKKQYLKDCNITNYNTIYYGDNKTEC